MILSKFIDTFLIKILKLDQEETKIVSLTIMIIGLWLGHMMKTQLSDRKEQHIGRDFLILTLLSILTINLPLST